MLLTNVKDLLDRNEKTEIGGFLDKIENALRVIENRGSDNPEVFSSEDMKKKDEAFGMIKILREFLIE